MSKSIILFTNSFHCPAAAHKLKAYVINYVTLVLGPGYKDDREFSKSADHAELEALVDSLTQRAGEIA